MEKLEKEFKDGEVLHGSELNEVVDKTNEVVDKINELEDAAQADREAQAEVNTQVQESLNDRYTKQESDVKNEEQDRRIQYAEEGLADRYTKEQSDNITRLLAERITEAEAGLEDRYTKQESDVITDDIDERLRTVEEHERIMVQGDDIGIATAADIANPTTANKAKVPTVGALLESGLTVLDISALYPTGGESSTDHYTLAGAIAMVDSDYQKGGISIKFKDAGKDGYPYVKYTLMSAAWSNNVNLWRGADGVGYLNVNEVNQQSAAYNNAAAARAAVPAVMRAPGLQITYLVTSGTESIWVQDLYIGAAADSTSWGNVANWKTNGPVSVSQNTLTGGFDINIGDTPALQGVDSNFISNVQQGYIDVSTRLWKSIGGGYRKYVITPINFSEGEIVKMKGNASQESNILFLSDYNPVTDSDAGVLRIKYAQVNEDVETTVPAGAKFLYIFYSSSNNNFMPQSLTVGKIDVLKSLKASLFSINNELYRLNNEGTKKQQDEIEKLYQDVKFAIYRGRYKYDTGWENLGTGYRYYAIASIMPGVPYVIKANGNTESHIVFLSEYNPVEGTTNGYISQLFVDSSNPTKKGTTPSNAKYIYVLYASAGTDVMPASILIGGIEYCQPIKESIRNLIFERYSVIDNYLLWNETLHRGYISSGYKWKDIDTGSRYYYVMPVSEGDNYALRSGEYELNVAFISDYNPVEDADAGVLRFIDYLPTDKSVKFGTVPTGANYVYILAQSTTNRLPSFFIVGDKFLLGKQVKEFDNLLKDFHNSLTSIIALNGGAENLTAKIKNLRFGTFTDELGSLANTPKCLTLLHFSDVHADTTNLARIKEFFTKFSSHIHDIVCTGDTQTFVFGRDFDYWAELGFSSALLSLGNHEVYVNDPSLYPGQTETGTGQQQTQVISALAYDKYIAPYLSSLGNITQPIGVDDSSSPYYKACYYYKDYTSYGIRLINLNSQKWDSYQKTWFESVLEDARTNSLQVIVMQHNPIVQGASSTATGHDQIQGCTFVDYTYTAKGWNGNNDEEILAVKQFIDDGGVFICWLTGHVHADNFGLVHLDPRQIDLNITTASHQDRCPSGETPAGTFMQDGFDLISIDTDSKILKVFRVGRVSDRYLQHHESCAIKYDSSDVRMLYCY